MKIVVNGEEREVSENIKIAVLLRELGIEEKTMASAVNMEVVKKENWESYEVKEGDKVEFLHFVGGG
ncbi:MAG: sulfur carrier protein ThiS [Epsilonproteobacteria bacterium]|nr:sulfur carrier protein ThiS [Campylobacterota bacterium]